LMGGKRRKSEQPHFWRISLRSCASARASSLENKSCLSDPVCVRQCFYSFAFRLSLLAKDILSF
jgi:hypothetical protein